MTGKGDSWNESKLNKDPETERDVRRLTASGLWNEKPTYHTNTSFTADGEYLVFARCDNARTAVIKCHLPSGELTQLTDWIDGVGSCWGTHKIGRSDYFDGKGVSGSLLCVAPRRHAALFTVGRTVRRVHLDNLEEKILIDDFGDEWIDGVISVNPSETHGMIPLMPAHPEVREGKEPTKSYIDSFAEGGMVTRYLEFGIDDGKTRVVFEDVGRGCAHCPHSPTDDDFVLIDRDLAPAFWCGSDHGKTPRCWALRLSTGELTALPSRNPQKFQTHAAWTWDGQCVVYHGTMREGGYYIGVINRNGETVREYEFPDAGAYGHVSADRDRPAIILDGNVTPDKLTWLYYDNEKPRLETIAIHSSEWGCVPGQYSHPHPQSDPTGRFIVYHVGAGKRSDVYAVTV
jgi:hypothetical protein